MSLQEGFTNFVRACSPSIRRKSEPSNTNIVVGQKRSGRQQAATNIDDPFELGRMVSGDSLGNTLHDAAMKGSTKQLKGVLKRGIFVDYPNDKGQTPLFCACYANQERTAEILLKAGANPNEYDYI